MSIVVTKCSPVIVGPSELGTSTGNIHLSSFDKAMDTGPVSLLLVFNKPIDDPVETVKRALSRALVHYYPISGRLAAGADGGDKVISCTGEGQGVLFVGASASCGIDDMPGLLSDLVVHYPDRLCRQADPLLVMQVTEFSCGGFAVGVTWDHVLADAAGMGQFLQAVGEMARGFSLPSVVPVRSDELVMAARPQGMTAADFLSAETTSDQNMAMLDFTIPYSLISRIKSEVSLALGKRCTTFEAAVAILWQCRARAVASDDGDGPATTTTLVFTSNARHLVGAAEGYYGNCSIDESAQATSAQVASGDTKDVVKLIKSVKHKVQEQINKGGGEVDRAPLKLGYNTIYLSSWRNLGLEMADFGGGRPARVMGLVPFCVLCPPWNVNDDGVNVMGSIVKKNHVNAFLHELAALTL
ncbi:acyl transferase 15-like [Lolium rigidum]|uniref:acyl transferase 15-like n=1 Tax=Lolium rigidum TaxID=89674 RepID=UPI001F5DC591|nr:acyl transferase 15-like [Lolium rigidum]